MSRTSRSPGFLPPSTLTTGSREGCGPQGGGRLARMAWTETAKAIVIMPSHILKQVIMTWYVVNGEGIRSSSAKHQTRLATEKALVSAALKEEHGDLAQVEVDEMPAEKFVKVCKWLRLWQLNVA